MSIVNDAPAVTVEELDAEQGLALFERACQRELGVSAERFLAAVDDGEFPEDWPAAAIQQVELLLPFAR